MAERKKIGKAEILAQRQRFSESSLANKATETERARQLEVRSEINGSFKDVVVALLCSETLVERGQFDQNMVRVKCKTLDSRPT